MIDSYIFASPSLRRPEWILPTLVGKYRVSGEVVHPAYGIL